MLVFFDHLIFSIYRWLFLPIITFILPALSFALPSKLKEMLMDRQTKWPTLPAKPIWIHASSGEIEYAKPLLRKIRKKWPQLPILVTYSSPSAKKLVKDITEIDAFVPLPWDTRSNMQKFVKHFQPLCCLIARTDVWPEMAYQLNKNNIPSLLFAATFSTESSRKGFFSGALTRFAFHCLSEIHCVSQADADELNRLKIAIPVKQHGDTRYDQVFYRLENPRSVKNQLKPDIAAKVFIAGSTWPEDDQVLLAGCREFLSRGGKMIWSPHEVNPARIQQLQNLFTANSLSHIRYSTAETWKSEQILILDQVGCLQELYTWSNFAFVGGSFKDKVHSVMEPLACGLCVLVGPKHQNNREALHFQFTQVNENLTAVSVIYNSQDLQAKLSELSTTSSKETYLKIQEKVRQKSGATDFAFDWVSYYLA